MKPADIPVTELQRYSRLLSDLLDAAYAELSDRERQAFLTYTVQRATIVLAPSTYARRGA